MKNINIITEAKVQKGDNIFVKYTGNMWSVGTALILVYWLSMAGMVGNAYFYYNYNVWSVNSNEAL